MLAVSHALGHHYMDEGDQEISLLGRLIDHARGDGHLLGLLRRGARQLRHQPGRTTHEAIFNTNDGQFRCPNAQQGFSGFTTWTRGLAWAMLGFPEQLEFLSTLPDEALEPFGGRAEIEATFWRPRAPPAISTSRNTPTDGIPYWDTGAPNLHKLGDESSTAPPTHSTTTSRSTALPQPSPARGCCGSGGISEKQGAIIRKRD